MGFPKALLDFHGETFLDRLIRLFTPHCAPVVAVLGAEADRIRAGLQSADRATIVVNPDYRQGQLTSMQAGLRAIPPTAAGVLFTLVDHPNSSPATITALCGYDAPFVIPRFQGRRGHPIWFHPSLIPEFLNLDATQTARVILDRYAPQIRYVDVDDPGILDDIDDPDSYRRLIR